MFKDGTYAAWFKTSRGEGTGIVHFADGKIWGRDSIITYDGSYEVDGDRFIATVTTRRHTPGHPTVFGIDEVTLRLVGVPKGTVASCHGTAEEMPGMVFEAALILSQHQPLNVSEPPILHAGKLPKLPPRFRGR